MSRWNLAWLLGIPAVFLLALAVSHSAPVREKDKDYELVRLMVDVLSEVDTRYVRELDKDAKRKLVEDMINGGLGASTRIPPSSIPSVTSSSSRTATDISAASAFRSAPIASPACLPWSAACRHACL